MTLSGVAEGSSGEVLLLGGMAMLGIVVMGRRDMELGTIHLEFWHARRRGFTVGEERKGSEAEEGEDDDNLSPLSLFPSLSLLPHRQKNIRSILQEGPFIYRSVWGTVDTVVREITVSNTF